MTKTEFISWLQSATFRFTEDANLESSEKYDHTDDEGQEHFTSIGEGWVWKSATGTLEGKPCEVVWQEAITYEGTSSERFKDGYDADNGEVIWNTTRPDVEDEDGDDLDWSEIDELVKEHLPNLTEIDYDAALPKVTQEEIEMDSDLTLYTIERDNAPDLRFRGEIIASASSKQPYGGNGRWTVITLYKTASGKYVCETEGKTQWQGELNRYDAAVCNTVAEVIAEFGHGWLAKELYAEAGIEDVEEI